MEEDPRRRNNFSFGVHAEISAEVLTKWRRKRRKNIAPWQLDPPSRIFQVLGSSSLHVNSPKVRVNLKTKTIFHCINEKSGEKLGKNGKPRETEKKNRYFIKSK